MSYCRGQNLLPEHRWFAEKNVNTAKTATLLHCIFLIHSMPQIGLRSIKQHLVITVPAAGSQPISALHFPAAAAVLLQLLSSFLVMNKLKAALASALPTDRCKQRLKPRLQQLTQAA